MTIRTVTALFSSRADADRAVEQLVSELALDRTTVRISPEAGAADTGYDSAQPYRETGFLASLRNLSLPEEDRFAFAEGMRRGNVLVSAKVEDAHVERAADILERAGAIDLDQLEAEWRRSGWNGYDASAAARPVEAASTNATTTAAVPAQTGQEEVIPIVEESLVLGKREVERGRTRIRSYVVERPVEEQVVLREEHVNVQRRPVDRPLVDGDSFGERVVEVNATGQEAVVSKQAHVVEEVVVQKSAVDRTETVHDTVRRTEVEISKDQTAAGAGAAASDNALGTTAGTGANPGKAP
jgi:uncharacterized protein (TIGR02271 family)